MSTTRSQTHSPVPSAPPGVEFDPFAAIPDANRGRGKSPIARASETYARFAPLVTDDMIEGYLRKTGYPAGLAGMRDPVKARDAAVAEIAKQMAIGEPKTPGAKRFSTEYALLWAKRQGWKILDRERYDARLKRHHDLVAGSDVMALSSEGIVLVQGAGRHERKVHRERYDLNGGDELVRQMRARFAYVEFVSPSLVGEKIAKTPALVEWWVS